MATKAKVSEFTDIRSLPRWQKVTIVTLILILAASFMISGVMLVVVEEMTAPSAPAGKIGSNEITDGEYRARYIAIDRLKGNAELWPVVPFVDPSSESVQPVASPFLRNYFGDATLPLAVSLRYRAENPSAGDNNKSAEQITGRLTWMHLMLYRLAREANVHVAPEEAAATARNLLVPDASVSTEVTEADVIEQTEADRKKRESRYAAEVKKLGMPAGTFEQIIAELMAVKRYVDHQMSQAVNVAYADVLDAYRASQQLVNAEYLRVPAFNPHATASVHFEPDALPEGLGGDLAARITLDAAANTLTVRGLLSADERDALLAASADVIWHRAVTELFAARRPWHPEIHRRAQEKLAELRQAARVRRELAQRAGLLTANLFPDPVEKFAFDRLKSEAGRANSDNYHETRYRLAIIAANYRDLEPFVVISEDKIKRYYEHYKTQLFPSNLTEDEIAARVNQAKEKLKAEHAGDNPAEDNQTQPNQTQPAAQWAPEGGWGAWETKTKNELRYRPLADVREEIREQLRVIGAKPLAHDLFAAVRENIDGRLKRNTEARNHSQSVLQARLEQAQALDQFYWGNPDTKQTGLIDALDDWESSVAASLATFWHDAKLADDPAGENSSAIPVDGPVKWAEYAAAVQKLQAAVLNAHWNALLTKARLAPNPLADQYNVLAEIERRFAQVERELAAHAETATVLASSRAIERLTAAKVGLERRKAEFQGVRAAVMAMHERLESVLATAVAEALAAPAETTPRVLLEAYALDLTGTVRAVAKSARAAAIVDVQADAAKQSFVEVQQAMDDFKAQSKTITNNLLGELPPDRAISSTLQMKQMELQQLHEMRQQAILQQERLQAQRTALQQRLTAAPEGAARDQLREQIGTITRELTQVNAALSTLPKRIEELERFPASVHLPVITVEDRGEFTGAFYDGLPGAHVLPVTVVGGLTVAEMEASADLRQRLPFFTAANEWKLAEDQPGGNDLRAVLRQLTEGAYSKVLGVKNVGLYMVVLLEKSEPPMPAVTEVMGEATEDYLVEMLHDQVAREFATEIQRKLAHRAVEVAALTPDQLVNQLAANTEEIAAAGLFGPNLRGQQAYDGTAIEALRALITNPSNSAISALPGAQNLAEKVRSQRAIGEARALLVGLAMAQIAREYNLPFDRTGFVAAYEDVPGISVRDGDESFVNALLGLAPHFEIAPVQTEQFPADSDDPEGRTSVTRAAYLVARSLGVKPNDRATAEIALSDLGYETADALRRLAENTRIAGDPNLQRFTDLGALMNYFRDQRGTPVEIYRFQPDYDANR